MSFMFEKDRKSSLATSSSSYSKLETDETLEKSSLQKVTKTPKRTNYGSLRTEVKQTANVFIVNYEHKLKPGETLQGISLKYGIPVIFNKSFFNKLGFNFWLNLLQT